MRLIHTLRMHNNFTPFRQQGFSLVELMVGLVIGLLATLAIMQVYGAFEEQKRGTSGSSDAQTAGTVALYTIQRDLLSAGYGLPTLDKDNVPLSCGTASFDHDSNAGTPDINMIPITIINGAAGASDTISVRYGSSASGGIASTVTGVSGNVATVNSNMNCAVGDVAYAVTDKSPATCEAAKVTALSAPAVIPSTITLNKAIISGSELACLGIWRELIFSVNGRNQLERQENISGTAAGIATPLVDGVVNIQAQYGISSQPDDNKITAWVDASGAWAAIPGATSATCNAGTANRNCIKAIRVAVITRNGQFTKTVVTAAQPTSWVAGPAVDVTGSAVGTDWQHYRYKTFETSIPFRNTIWARETLAP